MCAKPEPDSVSKNQVLYIITDMKKTTLILSLLLAMAVKTSADEGMWMVHAINSALEKQMQERGLRLSAREIYNADAEGASLTDAIVSLDFGCTGSIISDKGLLITNHHCAYSDVHRLSTPEHNYLEEGFWAMRSDEEVHIKGKGVYFLKRVLDVTEEVENLKESELAAGRLAGSRRISYMIEKKYSEETGLEASLSSMWSGSKYYLALYEVYKDIRLVAAPPVSAAAFGGDIDNWEWPQHKCDFAIYRVYTAPDGSPAEYSEENVPLKPSRKLDISLDGYKAGDYTMVIGYPGSTNRYSSSFETNFNETLKLPITNRLRGDQMAIIKRWMDADPGIRLKYSDYFFSLSNVQELYSGQVECVGRFDVVEQKEVLEKELQEWIETDPSFKERWGDMLVSLENAYNDVRTAEKNISYYRETLARGTRITRAVSKARQFRDEILKKNGIQPQKNVKIVNGVIQVNTDVNPAEEECCSTFLFTGSTIPDKAEGLVKEYENFDLRVEKDLFFYAVKGFLKNVTEDMTGPYHKEMLTTYNNDYHAIAEFIWSNSFFTDTDRLNRFLNEEHTVNEYMADPLFRFFNDVRILDFNRKITEAEGENDRTVLDKEYTHALYQMREDKSVPQYPDANSTMRITYGTVGPIEPYDGVWCDWKSTPEGILEKYDPSSYDYNLDERQRESYRSGDWGRWGFGEDNHLMYLNFLTDNDITGGNSGSPVLDADGKLIGLAFDGNKESLASDVFYTPGYNKCVCVDIRFVLWTLDRYAGMTHIIEEIGL